MAYFEFPHTRNYDGDLGWVIKKIIELTDRYNDFFEYNSITFADPLQWDITKQYPPYQIVFDYDAGYSYISKRPVPAGVTITNPDYWCLVGPLIVDAYARSEIQTILEFITNIYEATNIATAVRAVGDYVTANGQLYKVTAPINIGEGYTEGINVTKTTIETMIHEIITADTASMVSDISDIQNDISGIEDNITDINDPYTICIGDSYGEGYDPGGNNDGWISYLMARGVTGLSIYQGGSGFYRPASDPKAPITMLTNATTPDDSRVKRIIVAMGYNDFVQNKTDVTNNIKSFVTYCNTRFPNAVVYIGMCGFAWTGNGENITGNLISQTVAAYIDGCNNTKAIFMPQTTAVLLGINGLSTSDYKHPNATGNNAIADAIWAALHGDSYQSASTYTLSGLSNPSLTLTGELYYEVKVTDGHVELSGKFNNLSMNDSTAHSLYSLSFPNVNMPCLPRISWVIGYLFNNQDTGSGLAKSYYCTPLKISDLGYANSNIGFAFQQINDAGNNFGSTKKFNFNDSGIYQTSSQY